jgi:hypothetical protein
MQQPDANFEERNTPEPLPPRWLELLGKVDTVCATEAEPSPPTQPEQSGDGNGGGSLALGGELAGTEPAPPSLTKLLAQLEARNRTDMELRRWYGAVDRAVAELVRHRQGRTGHE